MLARWILPLLAVLLGAAAPPLPRELSDATTNEGWIWQQAQAGEIADLAARCGAQPFDGPEVEDERWRGQCRRVDPVLLRALLTQPDLADRTPHGVRIVGARIDGDLNLDDAHVAAAEVSLVGDWIAGSVILSDARLDGVLQLAGTLIDGQVDGSYATMGSRLVLSGSAVRNGISGDSMRVHNGIRMDAADIGGPVDFRDADIDGGLSMEGARIADGQPFAANRLHVGVGELVLSNVKFGGWIDLSDARVDGTMLMGGASVADQQLFTAYGLRVRGAWLIRSVMFGGGAQLRDAQVDGQMNMEGASVADKQPFDADRLHIGPGGLFLHNVRFGGPVSFHSAQIDGQMDMGGSSVADKQTFDAAALHVGADGLFLRKVQFGGPVKLLDAQAGQMDMEGASVADQQAFDAGRMHVGAGGLFMKNARFGGAVNLREARIDGTFTLEGTEIAKDQTFAAAGLYVGAAGLDLSSVKFGGPVELRNARVDGRMFMLDANIASDQSFDAEALHVGRDLFLRGTTFGGPVSFLAMSIDGGLDLRNTHLHQMNMGGAVVGTDFVLGGVYGEVEQWTHWDSCDGPTPCLNVRNVKAGNLQDDERAWPPHITLEGFTYSHLGGIGGEQRQDMRNRSIEWWRDWLDRDPVYSAQPYMQLASVLATAGNRDGAEEIRFFGRDRERSELLRGCEWLQELGLVEQPDEARPCGLDRWRAWIGLTALQIFVGYGIGAYNFRAVGWALLLALLGTIILCFAPGVRGAKPIRFLGDARRGPRQRSLLWCFGASLNRLLPLVTISEEFNEFFNDPNRERLRAWQHFAFGVLALCGWALGLFVVAAFSGLIQN